MGLVSRNVPPFTRDQQRAGIVRIIEDFNKEGMTGAKDPGIGPAKWELYQELLKEGKLTVRLFALWSGARRLEDNAQVLARVNAQPRPPASFGDGMLRVRRRQDVHGRQRRRAHRVDARGLEQELHREGHRQQRLSDDAARRVPADRDRAAQRRRARQHARDRRSRDRLGGRYLCGGARGEADRGPAPRHHPRQHADRSRDRRHGAAPDGVRRRLPGIAGAVHLVARRQLRRQPRRRARHAG